MARRVSSPEFVGRGIELAALIEALDRARGGEFSAAFVAGESGVGKSRLLREFEWAAEQRGASVPRELAPRVWGVRGAVDAGSNALYAWVTCLAT